LEKVLWKTISSAPLSPNASNGYINSIKISPEDVGFGAGKIENNKSMLLFLDTKPGGFNCRIMVTKQFYAIRKRI
jgi:hypothetical protein